MHIPKARFFFSLLLVLGLLAQAGGVTPAQAGAVVLTPQWLENRPPLTGNVANALYGRAVAANADGSRYVVGAGSELVGANSNQGAAYVYMRSGNSWTYHTLHAADAAAGDHFGISVAISGDGSTILVGAYQEGSAKQGAAYVFTWSGSAWSQQAKLTASNGAANDFFGTAVALSANGNTALIGANGYTASRTDQGGAYVFVRSSGSWTQQIVSGPIVALGAADNDWFGGSVALSGDGNTALIGAVGRASNRGTAYIYIRSGTSWYYQTELIPWNGAAGDDFGHSVALSADGNTALIGADNAPANGKAIAGVAYTFKRSGTAWANHVKLIAADAAVGDWFGYAVALSGDGSVAAAGAIKASVVREDGVSVLGGAGYVFYGSNFSQQKKLVPTNPKGVDLLGSGVASDGDGSLLLFGAPGLTWGTTQQGGVYRFERYDLAWRQNYTVDNSAGANMDGLGTTLAVSSDGTTAIVGSVNMNKVFIYTRNNNLWQSQAVILSNDPNSWDFGASVALSGDGNTALVGAWQNLVGGNPKQGAVYVLTRSGTTWSAPVRYTAADGAANDHFGVDVALSRDGNTAAIGADSAGGALKGAVYVMTRSGATWSALTRLAPTDPELGACFGCALALSGDGSTLLAGSEYASNGTLHTGATYVFTRSGGVYTQQTKLAPGSGYDYKSRYGRAVALSDDGNLALIGAPYWGTGDITGLVYIYTRTGTVWSGAGSLIAVDNRAVDQFGESIALSANGSVAVIGTPRSMDYGVTYQGAAYVYTHSGSTWTLQGKLISQGGTQADEDASAVALSGDGHTLLMGADGKNSSHGGAYFFTDLPNYPVFVPVLRR
jgi:hypothetical protein